MLLEEFDVEKYERSLKEDGFEEGQRVGIQRGIQQGIQQGQTEWLKKMLRNGMSEEQIAFVLEIPIEQVREISLQIAETLV